MFQRIGRETMRRCTMPFWPFAMGTRSPRSYYQFCPIYRYCSFDISLVHLWSRATAAKVNIWQFFAWNCVDAAVHVADTQGQLLENNERGGRKNEGKFRREDYKGNWRVKPEPVSTWTTTLEMVIGRYCSAKWRVRTGWYNSAEENDFARVKGR